MSSLHHNIVFHSADVRFSLKHKREMKQFLAEQLGKGKRHISLSYVFCSDTFLLDINRKFLKHDYYTDIITFPLSDTKELLEAEIYISVDRVKDNAQQLKLDFGDEIQRVIFHGALHLLGHKDKTKADSLKMRNLEDKWLKLFKTSSLS